MWDEFTIAGLAILFVTSCIIDGNFDYVDTKYIDNFPVLKKLHERIKEHDVVTKWVAKVDEASKL